MVVCRHQTFITAPVESIWDLVGTPSRHAEWWPNIVEVQGRRFGRGCSYCQVSRTGDSVERDTFVIERLERFRELLVRCRDTGLYMRWLLTSAQEGTFVDAEFGIDPVASADEEAFDAGAAKHRLRTWLQTSLDGLADAARVSSPGSDAATVEGPSSA